MFTGPPLFQSSAALAAQLEVKIDSSLRDIPVLGSPSKSEFRLLLSIDEKGRRGAKTEEDELCQVRESWVRRAVLAMPNSERTTTRERVRWIEEQRERVENSQADFDAVLAQSPLRLAMADAIAEVKLDPASLWDGSVVRLGTASLPNSEALWRELADSLERWKPTGSRQETLKTLVERQLRLEPPKSCRLYAMRQGDSILAGGFFEPAGAMYVRFPIPEAATLDMRSQAKATGFASGKVSISPSWAATFRALRGGGDLALQPHPRLALGAAFKQDSLRQAFHEFVASGRAGKVVAWVPEGILQPLVKASGSGATFDRDEFWKHAGEELDIIVMRGGTTLVFPKNQTRALRADLGYGHLKALSEDVSAHRGAVRYAALSRISTTAHQLDSELLDLAVRISDKQRAYIGFLERELIPVLSGQQGQTRVFTDQTLCQRIALAAVQEPIPQTRISVLAGAAPFVWVDRVRTKTDLRLYPGPRHEKSLLDILADRDPSRRQGWVYRADLATFAVSIDAGGGPYAWDLTDAGAWSEQATAWPPAR